MKLLSLQIRNFKGIADFTFAPGGRSANILGENATGKTTIMDAWLWLLYGRDSLGQAAFDVQPIGSHGQGVETEVSAEIVIEKNGLGLPITLRKTYAEKWTRKRGAAELSFDGHAPAYFVDGMPVGETQYKQEIAALLPDRLAKALTNPLYVNEGMKWQDRRALLFELAGDLSDDEIIASDERFAPLNERGRRTVDEYRKMLQADRKRVNGELDILPARIDEAKRAIGPECNIAEAQAAKARLQEEIKRLEAEASPTDAETRLATLRADLAKLEAENGAYIAQQMEAWQELQRREIQNIKQRRAGLMDKAFEQQTLGQGFQRDAKEYARKADEFHDRLKAVRPSVWIGDVLCPTCKRDLPPESIAEARRAFNSNKAKTIESLEKQEADAGEKALANSKEAETCAAKLAGLNAQIQECDRQIREIEGRIYVADILDGYGERVAALKNEMARLKNILDDDAISFNERGRAASKACELGKEIADIDRAIASTESNTRTRARIEELQGQKKTLGAELASLDARIYLCEEFARAKADMVTARVNGLFRIVRWKLFEQQVNGGIADTCEAMVGGVPYSSLNHSARINSGIDIINALSRHFGVAAPLFIDNAEAVTALEPTDSQVIRLVVDGAYTSLNLEVE